MSDYIQFPGAATVVPQATAAGALAVETQIPAGATTADAGAVEVVVRGLTQTAGEPRRLGGVSAFLALLREPQPADTVVEVKSGPVWILDVDVHHWQEKPSLDHIERVVEGMCPTPAAWFRSHGGGIKAIYVGEGADRHAAMAALTIPPAMQVEMLRHLRHPRSRSSKHGGLEAGELVELTPAVATGGVLQRLPGMSPRERIEAYLVDRGMVLGGRHDHSLCPIAGVEPSGAGECVQVLQDGIYCFRCAGKGVALSGQTRPGWAPFSALVEGGQAARIVEMAEHLVHWTHADIVMRHLHQNLGPRLRREAYRAVLEQAHGGDDPRLPMVFDPAISVVYTSDGWADAVSGEATEMDNDMADALPGVYRVEADGNDGPGRRVLDRPLRSTFKARTPPGYPALAPYRGLWLGPAGDIPWALPSTLRHPVRFEDHPLPEAECWAAIQRAFPGISPVYLKACLAAPICAAMGASMPPMIAATGPSGSGKTETVMIAGSFIGDDPQRLQMTGTPGDFFRQIGNAAAANHHLVIFDEFGRMKGLGQQLPLLLQLGRQVTFRPLFGREHTAASRIAIIFPVVRLPDWIVNNAEFVRRTKGIQLLRRVPDWIATSGGSGADWRDRTAENAHVANSLLTHVRILCEDCDFQFSGTAGCVADRIGLGSIADGVEATDRSVYHQLYRYARGEAGQRQALVNHTFIRGWLDLSAPGIQDLIGVFSDADPGDQQLARRVVEANLEAAAWNDILGIEDPPLQCQVKTHGRSWAFRFISPEGHQKGAEPINEQLPPIPPSAATSARAAGPEGASPTAPPPPDAAAEALRGAGFPLGGAS